jgi:hypothetical protein
MPPGQQSTPASQLLSVCQKRNRLDLLVDDVPKCSNYGADLTEGEDVLQQLLILQLSFVCHPSLIPGLSLEPPCPHPHPSPWV